MSYSKVLDVVRLCGTFNQALNEAVGTGDGTAVAFSFDNANVVKNSETVYVAGAAKIRDTDYSINFEAGTITFLNSAPAQSSAVTANYKYFPDTLDLTNDDIEELIDDADSEIDSYTGKTWTNGNDATEYFEGRPEKSTTERPGEESQSSSETWSEKRALLLSHYPVQSITSIEFLDDDGTVNDTLTASEYCFWEHGKVQLIGNTIPAGKGIKKVKVVYKYGVSTAIPRNVKNLSACTAGIMIFASLTGGSFDEITSYKLGPKEVAVGEPYMNMREAINRLEQMRDRILNEIGRDVVSRMTVI